MEVAFMSSGAVVPEERSNGCAESLYVDVLRDDAEKLRNCRIARNRGGSCSSFMKSGMSCALAVARRSARSLDTTPVFALPDPGTRRVRGGIGVV